MGFVGNKGQTGPLSFVSKTPPKANNSCQLNFRRFVRCQLKFWLFVSCQLTPSRPSFINTAPTLFSLRKITVYRCKMTYWLTCPPNTRFGPVPVSVAVPPTLAA